MAVSTIVGSLTSQSFGTQSTQASGDAAAKAQKQADTRTEKQSSSTEVKLSAYGQAKGALAEAQAASQALDARKTAAAEDVKKAAANFVEAFNKANKTVAGAVRGESGALSDEARARLADVDLNRSLEGGNASGELKKIGIGQDKDGSLSIDSKVFDKALQTNPAEVRDALANAGQQVEKATARELSGSGTTSANAPGGSAQDVETQRTQREQAAAAQRIAEQRKEQTNNNVVAGSLAAYQRTFTG